MNFELDSTQRELTDSLRKYLQAEAAPLVDEYEAQKKPVPRHLVQAMREFGLLGGLLPEEQGGFGLSMTTYGTLIAEVAKVWPSLRSITSSTNLAASVLADGGSAVDHDVSQKLRTAWHLLARRVWPATQPRLCESSAGRCAPYL